MHSHLIPHWVGIDFLSTFKSGHQYENLPITANSRFCLMFILPTSASVHLILGTPSTIVTGFINIGSMGLFGLLVVFGLMASAYRFLEDVKLLSSPFSINLGKSVNVSNPVT